MGVMVTNEKKSRKWLWGCAGGCLGFILIVAVAIGIGVYVLCRPVAIPPAEPFFDSKAVAFLIAYIGPDDPLRGGMTVQPDMAPVLEGQGAAPGQVPQTTVAERQEQLARVLPIQLVAVLRPGDDEKLFHGGVVCSLHRFGRVIGMFLLSGQYGSEPTTEYRDTPISVSDEGTVISARAGSLIVSDDAELVKSWIDRLAEAEERGEDASPDALPVDLQKQLKVAYERLDPQQAIRFATINTDGELGKLLKILLEPEALEVFLATGIASDQVLSLGGQLRTLNASDGALTLFIDCAAADSAGQLQENLGLLLEEAGDVSPLKEVQMRRENPTVVRIDARVEKMPDEAAAATDRVLKRISEPEPLPQPPAEPDVTRP